ncbi:hypothetical protein GUJ93_ZPchr0010g7441 [Zizania palustris]|uniref:Uncharacterized protein n=1 Tax=Zizania palustris TaxID=103762 RepID=A0A8J5WH12_ZIZPA|nr:hypothetical protein GUJ93_ZPchr0010g7441 [Zizania palustris]
MAYFTSEANDTSVIYGYDDGAEHDDCHSTSYQVLVAFSDRSLYYWLDALGEKRVYASVWSSVFHEREFMLFPTKLETLGYVVAPPPLSLAPSAAGSAILLSLVPPTAGSAVPCAADHRICFSLRRRLPGRHCFPSPYELRRRLPLPLAPPAA